MPCDHCRSREEWDRLVETHKSIFGPDAELNYCPYCGEASYVRDFLDNMKAQLEAEWDKLSRTEEILDENGNPMIFTRPKTKPAAKPREMGVDLDKIDISYEESLLAKLHTQRVLQTIDMMVGEDDK